MAQLKPQCFSPQNRVVLPILPRRDNPSQGLSPRWEGCELWWAVTTGSLLTAEHNGQPCGGFSAQSRWSYQYKLVKLSPYDGSPTVTFGRFAAVSHGKSLHNILQRVSWERMEFTDSIFFVLFILGVWITPLFVLLKSLTLFSVVSLIMSYIIWTRSWMQSRNL